MRLKQWHALINGMAPDEGARLGPDDTQNALDLAVLRYSSDRPRLEAQDVTSPDGITVPLPTDWNADFSRVEALEIPDSMPPYVLPRDSWQPRRVPGKNVLLLVRPVTPGDALRVLYTLPHVLTAEEDTIPAKDREAVAHWAAALRFEILSAKHAGDRQATIASDSVDHAAKMPNYKALAEAQRAHYWNHLGIDPKRAVPAGTVVTVGAGRLLHAGPRARRRR